LAGWQPPDHREQAVWTLFFIPLQLPDNLAAIVEELQNGLTIRQYRKQNPNLSVAIAQIQPN
jgi:hypothetical protein